MTINKANSDNVIVFADDYEVVVTVVEEAVKQTAVKIALIFSGADFDKIHYTQKKLPPEQSTEHGSNFFGDTPRCMMSDKYFSMSVSSILRR